MERDIRTLDLGNLGDLVQGRAGRQFDAAVARVIDAVTDPEAARANGLATGKVVVTVTIEGTSIDDGGRVSIAVDVESKAPKARSSGAILVHLGGSDYGVDLTDPQEHLFDGPRVAGKE